MPTGHATDRAHSLRRRAQLVTAMAALLALVLSACGGLTKDTTTPGDTSGASSTGRSFTVRTLAGGAIQLPGKRPSVLLFFSVGCGACGPAAQSLAQAQAAAPGAADFAVVDVAGHETADDIKQFLSDYEAPDLGYAIDTDGSLVSGYKVTQLSTVLIVEPDGAIVFRAVEPSAETIRAELGKVNG